MQDLQFDDISAIDRADFLTSENENEKRSEQVDLDLKERESKEVRKALLSIVQVELELKCSFQKEGR